MLMYTNRSDPPHSRAPLARLGAVLCLAGATQLACAAAQELAPRAVLAAMEQVADWQLANPGAYRSDDWTEGVGDAGFMALAGISGNDKYRAAMRAVGGKNQWQLGPRRYHADDQVVGQMYVELYMQARQPDMIAPMRRQFDALLASPRPGSLDWTTPGVLQRWSWCDALFMGPPTWARLSAATGDPRYLDFAIAGWWQTSDYLYDQGEHLYFRDSRYFDRREANGRKIFWSRGNGWVMGGLVRMLQYIPEHHPQRPRFLRQYREMAERVAGLQQADGLWRASLLDPAAYASRESSGTALYTYALAWGVNQGILPRERYEPVVKRAWQALASHVQADGKLIHVQPIGEDPRLFAPQSSDVFAVGGFLLAGSELYRMALQEGGALRVVTVSNGSADFRSEESVEVDGAELALADGQGLAVLDAQTSRIVPSQALEGTLLFQADLAPHETRRYLLVPRGRLPAVPPVVSRAHARFVPERLDDFAWENDRVAHRTYGPALSRDPKEMLVSSGIDVWSKSVRQLVQDQWYRDGGYHADKGQGLDFYHVGRTRGCGGLGIYEAGRLHTSANFSGWTVLADGPLRTLFELRYEAWDVAGRKVAETRRISLDAGSHFSRVESRFSSPSPAPLTVGIGIVRREGPGQASQDTGAGGGTFSYWEPPTGAHGSNACALIVPGASGHIALPAETPRANEAGHYLALAPVLPRQPLVYYLGSAWSKGGDFADPSAWEAHVARTAARIGTPVTVRLSP